MNKKIAIDILNDFANNENTKYSYDYHGYDWEAIDSAINIVLKLIKQYNEVFKILSPIAKCVYWNYKNQNCTHTCRGCDNLDVSNPKTGTGILINNNRYCRLYEDDTFAEDVEYITDLDILINLNERECDKG